MTCNNDWYIFVVFLWFILKFYHPSKQATCQILGCLLICGDFFGSWWSITCQQARDIVHFYLIFGWHWSILTTFVDTYCYVDQILTSSEDFGHASLAAMSWVVWSILAATRSSMTKKQQKHKLQPSHLTSSAAMAPTRCNCSNISWSPWQLELHHNIAHTVASSGGLIPT